MINHYILTSEILSTTYSSCTGEDAMQLKVSYFPGFRMTPGSNPWMLAQPAVRPLLTQDNIKHRHPRSMWNLNSQPLYWSSIGQYPP
jgi:hypothetical protein